MPDGDRPSDADTARLLADGLILREGDGENEGWRLSDLGAAQLRLLRQIEGR